MKVKRFLAKNGWLIILGVISLVWVYPIVLIIFNSFKPYNDIMQAFMSPPKQINFDMYIETWEKLRFPVLLRNTLLYTVCPLVVIGLFAPMAAYKLSRTRTKLSGLIFGLIILPMMVPFQTYMITLTKFFAMLGINATRVGYIIANIGLCMPLAVFMIHGFVKNIPVALDECACIDGASKLRTYFSIILPLLRPIIVTVIVIDALAIWNDVVTNILILGSKPETINLQQALYMQFSASTLDWTHALPGIVMSIIPNLIFFIFMQKYIVAGITAGAVKE